MKAIFRVVSESDRIAFLAQWGPSILAGQIVSQDNPEQFPSIDGYGWSGPMPSEADGVIFWMSSSDEMVSGFKSGMDERIQWLYDLAEDGSPVVPEESADQ